MADQLFLERFLWFDAQARQGKYPGAAKLATHFEISTKTAQRSIEYFRDRLNAPLEYDPSLKGYYYVDANFTIPVMKLSEEELTSLLVSRKLLSGTSTDRLGDELSTMVKKLSGLISANLPGNVDPEQVFSFRWNQFYQSDSLYFRQISTALLNCRCLSICYYSPKSSQCTMRTVEPHHMVNYMGTWHLVAWCRMRNGWRDFVLSRMSMANLEDETFSPRPAEEWQPHLNDTFGIFQSETCFDVVLQFTPESSRWVKGQIWHPQQQVIEFDDGSIQLTIPVSHHAEIMMQILSHGSQVRVLQPDWLIKKVIDEIDRMSKVYGC